MEALKMIVVGTASCQTAGAISGLATKHSFAREQVGLANNTKNVSVITTILKYNIALENANEIT